MPGQSQSATLPRYTSNDSPPPAYYLPSHQKLQPRDSSAQLRRYLIELVAYTFQADFGQLNNILNPGRRVSPDQYFISILTDDEKTDLKRLAHSTSELQLMALRRRWSTTMKRERDSILESIVKPAKDLELSPPYILDMISTYAEHECLPYKRNFTMVGRYLPQPKVKSRYSFDFLKTLFRSNIKDPDKSSTNKLALENTLREQRRIIDVISPNREVRNLLGQALTNFKAEISFKATPGSWPAQGPYREGFFEVYEKLDPHWDV